MLGRKASKVKGTEQHLTLNLGLYLNLYLNLYTLAMRS